MSSQYVYNGIGTRLARNENGFTTRFVVDRNAALPQVLAETNANGSPTSFYIYGVGLASKILPDGTRYYYHFDSRGSTVALTDAAENLVKKYSYEPFGQISTSEGSVTDRRTFVGRFSIEAEIDDLYFSTARYYSSSLGRFTSEDPARIQMSNLARQRNFRPRTVDHDMHLLSRGRQAYGQRSTGADKKAIKDAHEKYLKIE